MIFATVLLVSFSNAITTPGSMSSSMMVTRDSTLPLLTIENVTKLDAIRTRLRKDTVTMNAINKAPTVMLPKQFGVIQNASKASSYEGKLPPINTHDVSLAAVSNAAVAAYFKAENMDPQAYIPLLESVMLAQLTKEIADAVYTDDQGKVELVHDTTTTIGKNVEFLRNHPEVQKLAVCSDIASTLGQVIKKSASMGMGMGGMGGNDNLNP